ncbi:MAG: hypothetical protein GC164_05380 [Phycisphaera sp.]|nr:hypothetical protein [Phycisphaera sp.]
MSASLEPILRHLPAWLLVLFRLTGIFLYGPVFGSLGIPMRVKAMLALLLSLCIYPVLLTANRPSAALIAPFIDHPMGLWQLIGAIASELMIGLVIGFIVSLPLVAMQVSGHVIDQQLGMGLAGIYNPELDEQSGIMGEFFYYMALVTFLLLGGHRVVLGTLIDTFGHVPLGGFHPGVSLVSLLMGMANAAFELAVRVAAPLLCLVFLETVAMGFIARTVPQMNILSVGFPLRILVGVSLVIAALAVINGAFEGSMNRTLTQLAYFFGM